MNLDLNLLERWLTGWCLARRVPPPKHLGGGLVAEVGLPEQLRRHVFLEAGPELSECAAQIHEPFIFLKAAVDTDTMRRALPTRWTIESPGYLMYRPSSMNKSISPPAGYAASRELEHGIHAVRLTDSSGQTAALGHVVLNRESAIFDRIETLEPHRRKGLGSVLMHALDEIADSAGASERLLVATEAGRALYLSLGWRVLAPYSTAVLPVCS
ncbi:GNAT family N-acetyltransferase [Oxalobacteraceae bacterium]|nr:GNAT family N-acetyltransferase [Oxalobacteraceae bacterium]